jgi:hypothetical protein
MSCALSICIMSCLCTALHALPVYCRISNLDTKPVYMDQLLLQYWFHGPLDGTVVAAPGANATDAADAAAVLDPVALVSASQFRLTCSDASPEIGERWAVLGATWDVHESIQHLGLCQLDIVPFPSQG